MKTRKRAAAKPKKTEGTTLVQPALPIPLAVYKQREFDAFSFWMALPATLFRATEDQLQKLGIVDDQVLGLLRLKTQGDFARAFALHEGTLSEWKTKLAETGNMDEIRRWARQLTKNVVGALYRTAVATGKKQEVQLWLEVVEQLEIEKPPLIKVEVSKRYILIGEKYEQELEREIDRDIRGAERLRPDRAGAGGAEGEGHPRGGDEEGGGAGEGAVGGPGDGGEGPEGKRGSAPGGAGGPGSLQPEPRPRSKGRE